MMTEQAKVPAIRFAGFTDPWEQRKFVDFVEASGIRNKDNLQLESYSVSNDRGFVPQDEQFENGGTMRDADKTAYWIVEPGSFAYNPARINVGSIGYQSTRKNVIVSSLYEVFKTDRSCDDRFLWHWFKSSLFTKQIEMLQEGGVRLYFFFDKLQKSEIWMPNVDEQRIIGQQFDQLDSLITLHQRKYDKLVILKKSMLEKMFPKDGESVPEIRFAGFTDPWEQRKFGDCFEFLKSNTLSRAGLNGENGTARNVHYGDILIKFGDCLDGERSDLPFITDDTVLPKFAGSILREGDVIFADTAEDEAAGKCVELRKLPKEPTISGLHTIPARPRFFFGTGYLGHYLNSDAYHRQLLPLMQGIKVISVSKAALQDTQVRFPGLSEQAAIGAALSEIDNLITLHQRKLELLQNIKKSLLDKMFV
ncbi:restriction endonuclease subunit S [Bifidobacterium breve]|nr:restriction endonuclease subunit S [Bifidobacterium breve]MDB1189915.1 restriction endonuclease subunit S [Bifidobacterium breve]MDK7350705.1 restriction endonuclease subunit S [Bifidobacterium breve]MED7645955.1 restriction endonuclease subunit S [Bifidobacterium breve]